MQFNGCFREGIRGVEGTPTGISKVPRKTPLVKLFDPLSSSKLNTDSKCCNASMLTPDDKARILGENNNDLNYLVRAETDILEEESLYAITLPENLAEPLIPTSLHREKMEPTKKYSEEEFHKIMTAHEFFLQKKLLCECEASEKNQMRQLTANSKLYNALLSEVFVVLEDQNKRIQNQETKLESLKMQKELLKADINSTREDQNNAEKAFTEIHSRYETSKSMIRSYKENIELLNQSIKNMHKGLDENAEKYKMLESRTHDLLHKATKEAENAKKITENEIVCLTAQLKREQIKMSNLEDELVQAKSTNDKLAIIYKDLIAKLSA